jgi:hypothetical protein
VDEASASHRFDGSADRLPASSEARRQDTEGVGIRWHRADLHRLAVVVKDVDVEAFPA